MAVRRRLDFVVLCESKLRDATSLRALAERVRPGMHLRILNCSRPVPADEYMNTPASGGILILVLNPSLTIIDTWDDKRGLLSFSARLPGAAPFACVCVYLPDASSPFSRWTDGLIEASASEVKRRRAVYGDLVFWLGDFNVRVGTMRGRISLDNHAIVTPRVKRLRYLMRSQGMLPIHGRAPHLPPCLTSYHVAGLPGAAEVDYIMAPAALSADTFRLIPSPTWGSDELPRGSHIPLFVEVQLPHAASLAPAQPKRQRRLFFLPPYCDSKWFDIHRRIARDLPRTLRLVQRPGITLKEHHDTLTSLFRSAAIAECGTDMPRVRTFKHRLYKGVPLPTELVTLFDLARYQRRQCKKAVGERARSFWKQCAVTTKRSAVQLADSFLLRFRTSIISNLQHLMRIDPHSSHTYLAHLHGAEASNCADPSLIPVGPDGVPPLSRFGLACKRLVTQIDACPSAATSQQWLGHVFNAPGGVELIREFTAREIYPFLFPPTTRHAFEPCHPVSYLSTI